MKFGLPEIKTVKQADCWLRVFSVALLVPLIGSVLDFSIYDALTYLAFVFTVWAALYAGRAVFLVSEQNTPNIEMLGEVKITANGGATIEAPDVEKIDPTGCIQIKAAGGITIESPDWGKGKDGNAEQLTAQRFFWVSLFLLASAALTLAPTLFKAHPKVIAANLAIIVDFLSLALVVALGISLNNPGEKNTFGRALLFVLVVFIFLIANVVYFANLKNIGHKLGVAINYSQSV